MNTIPVPPYPGVVVKDAAGLTYFLPSAVASAVGVTDPKMKAHLDMMYKGPVTTDPVSTAPVDAIVSEVSAYSMTPSGGASGTAYDPALAALYNTWANIQLCLGAKRGTDNYKDTYDVNGDGIIDDADAAIIKQKIYEHK